MGRKLQEKRRKNADEGAQNVIFFGGAARYARRGASLRSAQQNLAILQGQGRVTYCPSGSGTSL